MNARARAALGVLSVAALLALGVASPAHAAPGPWTFSYTGEPQTFTVPPEVTKLSIIAIGGAGGRSSSNLGGAAGGVSGMTYGRFAVTPGEELTIWVGDGGKGEMGLPGIAWGFGCGATGGEGEGLTDQNGGGGGGSSAVTRGATGIGSGDCTTERPGEGSTLIVGGAGGGGGANEFIPPPQGGISRGGLGGNGGSPAGQGGTGGIIAPGGCGACQNDANGQAGAPNLANGGGAGGGGGGYRGGAGGGIALEDGGGGGGGGSSFINSSAEDTGFLAGYGSGAGSVTLSALGTEAFGCTGSPQSTTVPEDAGQLKIEADGAHGGSRGAGSGGPGGLAGYAMATLPVEEGEQVEVYVGCAGGGDPGWGYGSGGYGGSHSESAVPGAGGGGGSAVVVGGSDLALVAGGGGGGGGNGGVFGSGQRGTGGTGGAGGIGGFPAGAGKHAEPEDYAGGHGGEGGNHGETGGEQGGNAGSGSEGGGGGGGGGGWFGGGGGYEGRFDITFIGGGGGGGGGGMSGVHEGATEFEYGTSNLGGNGLVELTYLPAEPAAIVAHGGSKQTETVGGQFAAPLAALVTDAQSKPVANAAVQFSLPASGASGTFGAGGTTQTVATGTNGVAESTPVTANLTAGAWEATATVEPVSTPASFSLTNEPAVTATAVTASKDPATPTEEVTFTAVVTAAPSTAGTPTGSVQFKVDGANLGAPVALSAGSATSTPTTGLAAGNHVIEAVYEGAPSYLASSGSLTLPVLKTPTATQVSSSLNPALPTESMTFTAAIAVPLGNDPYTGTVQFSVDGVDLGPPQAAVNGTATSIPFSTTVVGQHVVVASVAETADYLGSAGETIEVVDPDGTAVEVGASSNPAEFGLPFSLEAEVKPRPPVTLTPTGTVAFSVAASGCTGTLSGGTTSCALPTALDPGPHEIDAHYSGDSDYDPSDGAMQLQVTKAFTETTVAGDPAEPSTYGEPVSFEADVGRINPGVGTPTGTVQFALDGAALGGPLALDAGAADAAPVGPDAGPHVVSAAYSGDADFLGGTGVAPYLVEPAPTEVALTAMPEPSQPGQPVTFAAAVSVDPAAAPDLAVTPLGKVQFRVDGLDFGAPVQLVEGAASSAPYGEFEPGDHQVAAVYVPANGNFDASAVNIDHAVDQPTITVVASSSNPSPPGAPVTFAAHVGPLAPAGNISFQVDGNPAPGCQSIAVENNDAQCTLAGLAPGVHDVRAAYSGAPLYDPSQGSLAQEVESPPCTLRRVRGRLLVFHKRNAVRLVSRYKARAKGRVTIRFYTRKGEDRTGRLLGTLQHTFHRHGRDRIVKRFPAKQMRKLRRQGRGFIARFQMKGDSGYCARAFSKDLGIRRLVEDQSVWFQTDSGRAELPPDSR